MKRTEHLLHSLIVGAFMCTVATGASAHNSPPKQNNFVVLMGEGETLQLAFVAECNGPKDTDDDTIVPLYERQISFMLRIDGKTAGGGEYIDSILMLNGTVHVVDVPPIGQLLTLSFTDISGQGECQVMTAGRIKDSSGNTRTGVGTFFVNYHTYPN